MDTTPNPTELARALAALRRTVPGACAVCGTAITGTTKRRFCGEACRSRAYRERRDARRAVEAKGEHPP